MSDANVDLSLSAERRIDDVCVRFENALKAGGAVRIEDFLDGSASAEGAALLRELVKLDVDYRQRRGEAVAANEYRDRFPDHAAEIATWLPAAATILIDTPAATPRQSWPSVPGYNILAELGRGGMGVVYQARHEQLQRVVALKMILAGSYAGAEHRDRFVAEARAVGRLQHPHIVQIHEIGEHDGLPYFSMEFVDGGSLAARLRETQPSDMEAARLVELLARTVHYAHGRGIVHRDLKPANILLTSDGVPKIADFGLAKFLDMEQGATISGAILGTPSYMAPEQAGGRASEVGPAIDVYALGAILYELLTGRPPFRGESLMETLRKVQEESPQPPHVFNPRVDPALEAICLKCLEKSPRDRYETAEALAEDLAAFLRGESVHAHSGTASRLFGAVLRETRYTEVMRLWSGVWMGLAVNAFFVCLTDGLLLWYQVRDYTPYYVVWIFKLFGDWGLAWFLRARTGIPLIPVERQLLQIWVFFWANHFVVAWLYQRSGGPIAGLIPISEMLTALTFGAMGAILGGSFYLTATLCVAASLLNAARPGIGCFFGVAVTAPYFFWLGWKHSGRVSTPREPPA